MPRRHGMIAIFRSLAVAIVLMLSATPPRADATRPIPVVVGITASVLDAGLFIAYKRGYFLSQGLDVKFGTYDRARMLTAPLKTGQLAVANLPVSAAMMQAVADSPGMRIVADGGSTPAGFGRYPLMVRKPLSLTGRIKTLKDLKGLRVAVGEEGGSSSALLAEVLSKAGLKSVDISLLHLPPSIQFRELQNGGIDAALMAEPWAADAIKSGAAVRTMDDHKIYPDRQVSVLVFSGTFADPGKDLGRRFLRAYLQGVRDYADAHKAGALDGPAAEAIIAILSTFTVVKDSRTLATMLRPGFNPDGRVNIASLKADVRAHLAAGALRANLDVDRLVDPTFAEWAAKQLGSYRPR